MQIGEMAVCAMSPVMCGRGEVKVRVEVEVDEQGVVFRTPMGGGMYYNACGGLVWGTGTMGNVWT